MSVAKEWGEVRATLDLDEKKVAEERDRLRVVTRAHRLAEIRREQGLTQTQVAKILHISQARVSKIERGDVERSELGTLQAYVEALGGRVEVVASFGDRRVVLG